MAAFDYFLKLDGIKGESQDVKHKDEIDVESFSWGATQPTRAGAGGGGGAGKVVLSDFSFSSATNRSSPKLFLACATGQHIKSAVLVGRKAGGDQKGGGTEFIKYSFSDVLVSHYGEGAATAVPLDQAALRYATVTTTTETGPTGITPRSFGAIVFDPVTGKASIVEGAGPHLLVGLLAPVNGGAPRFQRGLVEFDLSSIRPVLTGPGNPHLLLRLTEIREAATPPAQIATALGGQADDVDGKPKRAPKPHQARFLVLHYEPADLVLTVDDFDRPAHRLSQITLDPAQPPAELTLDLTRLVTRRQIDSLGLRIQSALDHSGREQDDDDDGDGRHNAANGDHDDRQQDDDEKRPALPVSAAFDVSLDVTFA